MLIGPIAQALLVSTEFFGQALQVEDQVFQMNA